MSATVTVRPAHPSDDRPLAELDAVAWPPELVVVPPQPAVEPFFHDQRRMEDVLVAEVDGHLAGYVRLDRHVRVATNEHVLHLDALAVHPAQPGNGVGSALVAAAVDAARSRGARKLGLRALSTNVGAPSIYRRLGFTEEGRLREEFRLPDGTYADDLWSRCSSSGTETSRAERKPS